MRPARLVPFALLALAVGLSPAPAQPAGSAQVEVVFVLDTTSSMGPLLDTIRDRIYGTWAHVLGGKPTPAVRVGVVAFRDKGDAYVTKVTDLSPYPDEVFKTLKELRAEGGGDSPEHVNQALDDAVNKISWTPAKAGGPKVLRVIFLMGDAPPHLDYPDDVKYPESCKAAGKKGIVINTIACGGSTAAQTAFKDIATLGKGAFFATAANGGDAPPATKQDRRLQELHDKLVGSYRPFGKAADQRKQQARWAELAKLSGARAVDRVVLEARLGMMPGDSDLVDASRRTRDPVVPSAVPAAELPPDLAAMEGEDRDKAVAELAAGRGRLYKEAADLGEKRTAAIRANPQPSFDGLILTSLRTQGTKAGLKY